MAITKQAESSGGGNVRRGTIIAAVGADISVTTAPQALESIASEAGNLKNATFKLEALSSAKAKTTAYSKVMGDCIPDGAGNIVPQIFATASVTVTSGSFLKITWEIWESNTSD